MKWFFVVLTLVLALPVDANPIDSLIQDFDKRYKVETANRFLDILHRGGLAEEPVTFTQQTHPDTLRMQTWYWATEYYHAVQQYDQAIAYGLRALPLCHAGGDRQTEGNLLSVLSICYVRKGDFKQAATYAKRCNEIDLAQGDPDCISSSLNTLAGIYMSSHQPEEAEKYILQALDYAAKAGNPARLAVINGMASEVYKNLKNDTLALEYGTRAYEIEKALGRKDKAAMRQTVMASALVGLQRPEEAKRVLSEAIPVLREAGDLHSLGIACNHMGLLLIQEHRSGEAVTYFNEAQQIFQQQGDIYNEALSHRGLYQALYDSQPREAMLHNMRYNELRDSLYDKDTGELLSKYAAQYGNEELLQENLEIRKSHRRIFLYGILAVAVLALGTWLLSRIRLHRQRRHTSELMQRIDRMSRQYEAMRMGHANLNDVPNDAPDHSDDDNAEEGEEPVFDEKDRDLIVRFVKAVDKSLPERNCNVEHIARTMGMSGATLRRRIQEASGDSPKTLISAIQMQKACIILTNEPDLPINEVALRCGFDETGNFTRVFKRTFGITPSQFIKQNNA